ncbi:hypothetical protein [Amycolatopsis jiangsuensis]|uniref:Lipoprotein n=1 Tax=Amycolatopsis jiangsuensis TaxID=1181879 RepID=A0A840INI2_9PSEU|nr:hypothetical protein [Amycolatopsis jiangsuensis]MBB4682634.1 hypothetical protein [Amycolatopsis jiangsuensis]
MSEPTSSHPRRTGVITARKSSHYLAAAVGISLLLSGCAGAADADRTNIDSSLRGYLDLLEDNPQPAPDDVLAWVSNEDGGKDKARSWLTRHPGAQANVERYIVSDPYESDSNEPEAHLSVQGQACPEPGRCRPYPTDAGTINLKREGGQYLLDEDTALKFFGYEK